MKLQKNKHPASITDRRLYCWERGEGEKGERGEINTVRTFPDKISWLTIAEFWNNVTWNQNVPYGFRITLGIGKPVATESDLYFILDGQDCELFADDSQKYTTLWKETNEKVKVPIGQWFTLEYYYKEGDAKNGKFYMTIQPDGGKKK